MKNEFGGLWIKIHGGMFQMAGIPDLIGCLRGRFYGIEVKLPGKEKTLTVIQKAFIKQIIEVGGGRATMVTSVSDTLDFIREGL